MNRPADLTGLGDGAAQASPGGHTDMRNVPAGLHPFPETAMD